MKRVLLDTNVVLDVLLDRKAFVEASAAIWNAVESGLAKGMLPAHSVTTEGPVCAAAVRSSTCDFIVTRDPKGFRGSLVPVVTPESLLPLLLGG